MNTTREQLAANAHNAWARWTRHLLDKCHKTSDGGLVIPCDASTRWERLIATPYDQLTQQEKASDRAEADLILNILHKREQNIETD